MGARNDPVLLCVHHIQSNKHAREASQVEWVTLQHLWMCCLTDILSIWYSTLRLMPIMNSCKWQRQRLFLLLTTQCYETCCHLLAWRHCQEHILTRRKVSDVTWSWQLGSNILCCFNLPQLNEALTCILKSSRQKLSCSWITFSSDDSSLFVLFSLQKQFPILITTFPIFNLEHFPTFSTKKRAFSASCWAEDTTLGHALDKVDQT